MAKFMDEARYKAMAHYLTKLIKLRLLIHDVAI